MVSAGRGIRDVADEAGDERRASVVTPGGRARVAPPGRNAAPPGPLASNAIREMESRI